MTAAELIEKLKELPGDSVVFYSDSEEGLLLVNCVTSGTIHQNGRLCNGSTWWDTYPANRELGQEVVTTIKGIILEG